MIAHFLKLEWKQYFRSSYWEKGIALKIIMGFFILYMIGSFLMLGIGGYFLLKEIYPTQDPLKIVNSYLVFALLGDLVFRYMMQKLPVMKIKPLLILPIKKEKLVHYVLGKAAFSVFNFLPLFFYIPFAVVLIWNEYAVLGVLGWLVALFFTIQSINFLNFLINKNTKVFVFIAGILVVLLGLEKFSDFEVSVYSQQIFDEIMMHPIFAIVPLILAILLYVINFKLLRKSVYLDALISEETNIANSIDLSWAEKLGDVSPFIKNDIRLIWRNKRTKTVFLMSFLFLFYGLIFFTQESYKETPVMLMFAALFVTGGFTLNYGQFIPAWDSAHYKMLMSQSFRYRKFLDSKWFLMVGMTSILYFLSVPYLYFGTKIFLMITCGAIFNIGFNSLFLLYIGSFNRKRIDITNFIFENMQVVSAIQYFSMILLIALPMLLFWVFNQFVGYNSGFIAVALVGIIGLVFKNYFMNLIEKKYIKDKYAMINAFGKEA
ncbi:DUF5687 family protein [Tenacibaculum finnmarkense]|uniref:DUF5687 family protein n=1 Tax=Tenacibaculum finnmarkense TaxID=2781243 RepID=UPI001E5C29EE|nr:DUF5687 family protein [Tenacibaculum finnmarkense]MCD8421546.1 DUF5687 family protein [Tenacibaculum finnmarkense genomovar ulcerans]MCG8237678.1 hypothetical protein [Tenacibaculum finnmarkense genomovar ulcerans]